MLRRLARTAVVTGVGCIAALAQTAPAPSREILPLPFIEPQSLPPKPNLTLPDGALTPGEKVDLTIRKLYSPQTFANRLLRAGMHHWQDYPEEWGQGWDAFGRRFASRYSKMALREGIQLGTDIIAKTDPRYDRCACSGFLPRVGHAWKRVVVARKDYGGETLNWANFTGAYVTQVISDQWYPDRLNNPGHHLKGGTMYLTWQGTTNMVREFWPEIKRAVTFGKKK
jgi:hypothetical protein